MPTLRRPGTGMSTCIPRIPRSYRGLRDVLIFKVIGLRSPFWKVLFECSPMHIIAFRSVDHYIIIFLTYSIHELSLRVVQLF